MIAWLGQDKSIKEKGDLEYYLDLGYHFCMAGWVYDCMERNERLLSPAAAERNQDTRTYSRL